MPVGAVIGAGVAGAGASIIGSNEQASATKDASEAQQDAQKYAADQQKAMYDQTRNDLLPYNTAGQAATSQLSNRLTELTSPIAPISMNQAQLEKTPGYQFNLAQGLKATQNSAAARGLGTSGAALKGAAGYATGLADSTYQNQFSNALANANLQMQNKNNAYNMLSGLSTLGENAAAQTGTAGTSIANSIGEGAIQTGKNIGNNLIAGGTAQSAGLNGAASSLTSGIYSGMQYNALKSSSYFPPAPSGLF